MERTITLGYEEEKLSGAQRLMHRWQSSQRRNRSRNLKIKEQNQQAFTDCTCVECGSDFTVQREGALYVCDRCTSYNV